MIQEKSASSRREELERRHGIDDKDCVIFFTAMNFHVKGLDRLIPGIAKLRSKIPGKKVKLLVEGKSDEKNTANSQGVMTSKTWSCGDRWKSENQ